jgi:hypothetical protein
LAEWANRIAVQQEFTAPFTLQRLGFGDKAACI